MDCFDNLSIPQLPFRFYYEILHPRLLQLVSQEYQAKDEKRYYFYRYMYQISHFVYCNYCIIFVCQIFQMTLMWISGEEHSKYIANVFPTFCGYQFLRFGLYQGFLRIFWVSTSANILRELNFADVLWNVLFVCLFVSATFFH